MATRGTNGGTGAGVSAANSTTKFWWGVDGIWMLFVHSVATIMIILVANTMRQSSMVFVLPHVIPHAINHMFWTPGVPNMPPRQDALWRYLSHQYLPQRDSKRSSTSSATALEKGFTLRFYLPLLMFLAWSSSRREAGMQQRSRSVRGVTKH